LIWQTASLLAQVPDTDSVLASSVLVAVARLGKAANAIAFGAGKEENGTLYGRAKPST